MADLKKEIDESLKTLNVVENDGEAPDKALHPLLARDAPVA